MLEAATGAQMSHVPFKGKRRWCIRRFANGDVAWAFGTTGSARPLYRARKIKFLAVAACPNGRRVTWTLPTVAGAGGPANFEVKAWVALHAPKVRRPLQSAA